MNRNENYQENAIAVYCSALLRSDAMFERLIAEAISSDRQLYSLRPVRVRASKGTVTKRSVFCFTLFTLEKFSD